MTLRFDTSDNPFCQQTTTEYEQLGYNTCIIFAVPKILGDLQTVRQQNLRVR